MPGQRKLAIVAAYAVLCVVWSSTWLAIKVGLRDLPPISFVAIRFVIAVAVLMAVSIGRVRLLPTRRSDYCLLGFTGLLMFALNYPLLFWGEKYVSSGLAAVLQATIPIFGMLFAHLLLPEEPMRWQRLAGALLALDGNPVRFHWSAMAWLCLLYLAVIGSALTFLLLYWLLPRMTVTNLQTISLITPPGAVAFGWFLGGETFSLWSLLGAGFVLAGVWIIFSKIKPPPRAEKLREEPS